MSSAGTTTQLVDTKQHGLRIEQYSKEGHFKLSARVVMNEEANL